MSDDLENGNGTETVNEGSQPGAGHSDGTDKGTQSQTGDGKGGEGSHADAGAASPFAELPEDTRTWLEKRGFKDPLAVAKHAFEQDKLLGNAIRVPGKDATEEEKEAFLNKLGRPATADEYDFKPPEDLPEDLPYDGDRAKDFKGLAHKIGLTSQQAQAVHDWAVANAVNDFKTGAEGIASRNAEIAESETNKLVKLWGPLDGQQAKTQLTFADKALEVGGPDAIAEFKRVGLIGEDGNAVLSAPIAVMMAKLGGALFKEDEVIRGRADRLDNPFDKSSKAFNVTAQMRLYREDPEAALAFIAATGKKPEDFGLKSKRQ